MLGLICGCPRLFSYVEADSPSEKPLDFHFLEARLLDDLGNGLWRAECSYGIGEVLVGVAVTRQARTDPWDQAVKVKGVEEGEKGPGRGKHVQGCESPSGS